MNRIAWRSLLTGYRSHGQPLPAPVAEAWIEHLMRVPIPNIEHWLEAA